MKAARLYDKETIKIEDIPIPQINDDEVLLKTGAAFICGTDVRFFKNGKPNSGSEPVVLGHEFAGTIEKVGKNVTGYTPGMRVAVAPNYGCGTCNQCVSGDSHLCRQSEAIGVTIDGGFAEYIRIPAPAVRQGNISPLSESISFAEAALAEPLSCVYNAYEKVGVYPGDTVLVIGAGPIGLMHARMAFLAGAAKIYINDLSSERLEIARRLIPDIIAMPADDFEQKFNEATGGELANVVITAASAAPIQQMAFRLAGLNGRIMFFGGLPKGKSEVLLDTNEIHYKLLSVCGTTRQSLRQYRHCIRLIESGRIAVKDIITASADLDGISEIISNVAAGKGLKSSIQF